MSPAAEPSPSPGAAQPADVTQPADALVLFGISGDLARKKLFSALYDLTAANRLDMPVIGVASRPWDDETLRHEARMALSEAGHKVDDDVFDRLAHNLCYISGDYSDAATYLALKGQLGQCHRPVFYLAIPPQLFDDVVEGISAVGLNDHGRLVVEKPFGRDTDSATELNEIVHRHFDESQVYRIDHFLGKESVQNLMIFRFSNSFLEPIWNRHYVRSVQLTMAEDFGIEGRGKFYESVGALRDVVQNHLLQMVSLLAMEPPVSDRPDALRDERAKVLEAIAPIGPSSIVRGQYQGYRDEAGVAPDSDTETFVAVRLQIDSWRWAGVPWIIRAGKAMARTVTEAVVELHPPPRLLFAADGHQPGPNRLVFRTKPDDQISLAVQAKVPGGDLVSGPVELHLQHDRPHGREAYDRLIGDALRGDPALFARQDGVMEAWRIVDSVLHDPPPVVAYRPGSWGPDEADRLLSLGLDWVTR